MKFDGKNLERLQKERGESNYRLAKELGVHQTFFAKWESGTTPHLKHMKLLAEHFGVTLDELVKESE